MGLGLRGAVVGQTIRAGGRNPEEEKGDDGLGWI